MVDACSSLRSFVPATSFVGRAAELQAMRRRLAAGVRLLTVVGPPGVGKTRLAVEFALRHAGELGAEALVCDLSETTNADEIHAAVAQMLVSKSVTFDPARTLGEAIAARGPLLLILDNFEQVADHAQATVGQWVRVAPDARFVVTSRERLGVPEEWVIDLLPLPLPEDERDAAESEAVRLLVDRVRAVRPDWAPAGSEQAAVAALVRALDGLPLAIELAAARMRVLSAAQMLARMGHLLLLLSATRPRVRDRHSTLRRAIEWSWRLLGPPEQAALAQCSVFQGGFDLDAAEAVLDLSAQPAAPALVDVLQSLCDKSLLRSSSALAAGRLRFSLLASIREFASEQLGERSGVVALYRRHAGYYLRAGAHSAAQIDGPGGDAVRARLPLEVDNLLAVHRRAVGARPTTAVRAAGALTSALILSKVLEARSPANLRVSLLDDAIEVSDRRRVDPALRARAFEARSDAHRWAGRIDAALRDLRRALRLAKGSDDVGRVGWLSLRLGTVDWDRGHLRAARTHYERGLRLGRRAGDQRLQALALRSVALVLFRLGQADAARRRFVEALEIHREIGDRRSEAMTIADLAGIDLERGRLQEGRARLVAALSMHRQLGDRRAEGNALGNLACVDLEQEMPAEAAERLERAIEIHRELGNVRYEAIALSNVGLCHLMAGRSNEACDALERAVILHRRAGNELHRTLALARLGAARAQQGRTEQARSAFETTEENLRAVEAPGFVAAARLHRGHLDLALSREALGAGDTGRASEHWESAQARLRKFGSPGAPWEARVALILLERTLRENAFSGRALLVARSGRWFRPPDGGTVDFDRRVSLRRLLRTLAEQRLRAPRRALSANTLLACGWPKERIHRSAALNRLHVAVSTLRKAGLGELLLRRDGGYLLDPTVPLVPMPDEPDAAGDENVDAPARLNEHVDGRPARNSRRARA